LKLQNPAKYQEAMDLIDKKKTLKTYANQLYEQKEPETVMTQVEEVATPSNFFDEYKKTINSDEVKGMQTELADK
jgi:hypothetical protein